MQKKGSVSMPWERKTVDNQRRTFAARAAMGEDSLSALCREYGISRPTGYKWLERYQNGETMLDRPHTPYRKPFKTSRAMELRIVDVRNAHPTWGARKIQRFMADKGEMDLPAASTINDILKRNGCISEAASEQHTPWKRFERDRPNALWQMDYKGHFGMTNGRRCHGLTILDDHSRFSLCLDAKENEQWEPTRESLERIFREFGLPDAILCDNGAPWSDNHGGYTPFEIWMMQMDVTPMHGKPRHPQTQGKDERFHRTLKEDLLLRKPLADLEEAQREFDAFRYCYNHERPHAALKLDVPAKHYKPSSRKLVKDPKEPEYDSGKNLRKVNCCGYISIYGKRYYLSESFVGKYIELRPLEGDLLVLAYGNFEVARIDLVVKKFDSRKIYRL